MKNLITRWLTAVSLGTVLAVAALPALSAPVTRAFTLLPDFGNLTPTNPSGSASWDDSQTPTLLGGETFFALNDFSLEVNGQAYTEADLDDAFAVFDGNGFIGLQVTIDGVLTLSPAHAGQAAFFAYAGLRSQASGEMRFGNTGTVSEPGVAALLLLSLTTAAAVRRRTRKATAGAAFKGC